MSSALEEDLLRRQVDQLLSSNTFRSCGSLRRLLEYLVDRALAGDTQDLKEYRIGVEGLGKEPSYDPRVDPSVRVQVGRLRSRLAEYYLNEGQGDPILITVPKGAFSIVFEDRRPVASARDPLPQTGPAPAHGHRIHWTRGRLAVLALCLLAPGILAVSRGVKILLPQERQSAAFRELWRPYFSSDRPVLISLGVPMWLRFQTETPDGTSLIGHLRDGRMNEWPTGTQSEEGKRLKAWKQQLGTDRIEPRYHYVAVGEAIGAILLARSLARQDDPTIVRSNMLSWDAVSGANVIFIGAPKFNPHLRNVPFSQNFRIGDFHVQNLRPGPGEKPMYPDVARPTDTLGAALIGRYQSPGGGSWFTLIGSANSMCTWAAIEYLTRPEYVARLTGALQQAFGRIPDSFEVVVEATFDQSSPVEVHHVALRELPNGTQ